MRSIIRAIRERVEDGTGPAAASLALMDGPYERLARVLPLAILDQLRSRILGRPLEGPPLPWPPRGLVERFTMGGKVPLVFVYSDGTETVPTVHASGRVDEVMAMVERGEVGQYGGVDSWLYEALRRHPVAGQRVAIMGSAEQGFGPWYECVCLVHGGQPTTIEYNPIRFDDPRIQFMRAPVSPGSYEPFDAAFSISSFEHDGLGRYGDPLDPDGDLRAMREMRSILRPGGLLYLSVPVGRDKVVFNAHRIYGRARLPLLLDGWSVIDSVGLDDALLDRDTGNGWNPTRRVRTSDGEGEELIHPEYPEYGPVLVLENRPG